MDFMFEFAPEIYPLSTIYYLLSTIHYPRFLRRLAQILFHHHQLLCPVVGEIGNQQERQEDQRHAPVLGRIAGCGMRDKGGNEGDEEACISPFLYPSLQRRQQHDHAKEFSQGQFHAEISGISQMMKPLVHRWLRQVSVSRI